MNPRNEWVGRAHFHEIAEALGVNTSDVMTALELPDGRTNVLWAEGNRVLATELERDDDGVYVSGMVRQVGTMDEFRGRIQEMFGLMLLTANDE